MSTQKVQFAVYRSEMLMHQYGERYTNERTSTESEVLGYFDTEAEALACLESVRDMLEYEVTRTKSGLDSITYDEACVNRELVEVDEDGFEDLLESNTIHAYKGMPEEVEQAAYKSMRSYHAYLDYEEDEYIGIAEAL